MKNQVSEREVVQELLKEFELLVDSTEQSGERPGEYKEQKKIFQARRRNIPLKTSLLFFLKHKIL